LKIQLEKINKSWSIGVSFPELESSHDQMLVATELLSFVQGHGELMAQTIELISNEYGPNIAKGAVSLLSQALNAISSGSDDELENQTLAEMPVVDGIFIEIK